MDEGREMSNGPTRRHVIATALAASVAPGLAAAQSGPNTAEMSLGDADAPVTMVEYAMFTCPHCAAFHLETWPQIKRNFVDTGKVRLVYREVYFNRASLWAAMIARCASPDRYFGVVDLLYREQSEWIAGNDPEAMMRNLYGIGRQAGLTDAEMDACMSDQGFAETLVAQYQKNAQADGIDSTPSFVIDGEKVGNMSYAEFETALNEALGE
jgi:protein-disulfide isomerase